MYKEKKGNFYDRGQVPKVFPSALKKAERERKKEESNAVIKAAQKLAEYFEEQGRRIRITNKHYQKLVSDLNELRSKQSFPERKDTTREAQRRIVEGSLPAGVMYYLEKSYVAITKLFRYAYQSLTEKERSEFSVSSSVNPYNGERLRNVLEAKAKRLSSLAEKIAPKPIEKKKPEATPKTVAVKVEKPKVLVEVEVEKVVKKKQVSIEILEDLTPKTTPRDKKRTKKKGKGNGNGNGEDKPQKSLSKKKGNRQTGKRDTRRRLEEAAC